MPAYSLMLGHQDWLGLDFPNSYKKLILNIPPRRAGHMPPLFTPGLVPSSRDRLGPEDALSAS